jgi:hypothetical protein
MFSAGTHTAKLVKNATAVVKTSFFKAQFFSRGKDHACRNSVRGSVNVSYLSRIRYSTDGKLAIAV